MLQRQTISVTSILAIVGVALFVLMATKTVESNDDAAVDSVWFDFSATSISRMPLGLISAQFSGTQRHAFHLANRNGKQVLADDSSGGMDVLYFKTSKPMRSVEESFSFVYTGPASVVEPFIINAKHIASIEGTGTNLSQSAPKNFNAGNIFYRYKDRSGQIQNLVRGRLRTEPYFYLQGHTYRVDAIADSASGLVTTRVYDTLLGSQTFDQHLKLPGHDLDLYPGLLVQRGAVSIIDFGFGPANALPLRSQPARAAREYMNYLGYNAGVSGPATTPVSLAFQKYFPDLLIKHDRVLGEKRFLPSINAVSRNGIDATILTGRDTTIEKLKSFIAGLKLPPDAIELWNEPNNPSQGAAFDPQYVTDLPKFAAEVHSTFPGLRVWGPSVLPAPNGYPHDEQVLSSSIGPVISAWNAHSYTQGSPENLGYGGFFAHSCGNSHLEDCGWYGSTNYNDNLSAVINPSLPGVTTEGAGSYGSYPLICGHGNVDNTTQQAYIERGMLYNYKLGHLRIYPYKFIDDGNCSDGGGTMGLLSRLRDADGQTVFTPKPAYVSLVYLDHILAERGTTAITAAPKSLSYTLVDAPPDIEELLLCEDDGSYRLILWSDKELWNFNANGIHEPGSPLSLVKEPIKIRFGAKMNASVYMQTPGTGAWRWTEQNNSDLISVTVTQFPLVIELTNAAHQNSDLLPINVPTAGPTEQPRLR